MIASPPTSHEIYTGGFLRRLGHADDPDPQMHIYSAEGFSSKLLDECLIFSSHFERKVVLPLNVFLERVKAGRNALVAELYPFIFIKRILAGCTMIR